MPLWRKNLHTKFGYFNEVKYKSAADYAFWIQCLSQGSRGSIVPYPASYYFVNPQSYMRVDGGHTETPKHLYEEFIINSGLGEIYKPNFPNLKKLISFIVN